MSNRRFFYSVFVITLIIVLMGLLVSCSTPKTCGSSNTYWRVKKDRGIEKYTYYVSGWPRDHRMGLFNSAQPVKSSRYKKLSNWKPTRKAIVTAKR